MCDCKTRFGHDPKKLEDCIFGVSSEVEKDHISIIVPINPKAHFYGRYTGKRD
jgi:hypothetical protein